MPDFREEWSIESIAGGIEGTRVEIEAWRDAWLNSYGITYEIHVQKRYVSDWKKATLD